MVKTSAAYSNSCSFTKLIPSTILCIDHTLDVPVTPDSPNNLNLYPNPINNGDITIAYQLKENSYIQFKIIDYIGRDVVVLNEENKPPGTYNEQINVNAFASGVYLLVANINGQCQTIKFIKL